jgi:hypothetical protein
MAQGLLLGFSVIATKLVQAGKLASVVALCQADPVDMKLAISISLQLMAVLNIQQRVAGLNSLLLVRR